jgi:glycosyltransferase involved in cell wall biosynthesis
VVVPAHNERERLPGCLRSVALAADRVGVPVRVVVVLDACSDGSADVVPASARTVGIWARNVGAARAAGFAEAAAGSGAGTWLATTDADSRVPATWLADQVVHYRAMVEGVAGTVCVDWRHHSRATQRRYERAYRVRQSDSHGHVHGANIAVRADAYWRVGGFRALRVGEDVDLIHRLARAEARIAWDTDNAVLTSDRPDCRARSGFGDYLQTLACHYGRAPGQFAEHLQSVSRSGTGRDSA